MRETQDNDFNIIMFKNQVFMKIQLRIYFFDNVRTFHNVQQIQDNEFLNNNVQEQLVQCVEENTIIDIF